MVESATTTPTVTWSAGQATSRAGRGAVSPGAHLAERFAAAEVAGPRSVQIREVPFLTMVGIRVVPGSPAGQRLGTRLARTLPSSCGAVADGDGVAVLWLSPDEFLVVTDAPAPELIADLSDTLHGEPGSVNDLSANRTTFELSGAAARAVLEKGCPLDLHPRSFQTGTAFVTTIGSVPVLLWKTRPDVYRLLPRSSFADFLGRWLIDAMAEFAAPEIP